MTVTCDGYCPPWCLQTTPHGIHQSAMTVLTRSPARWAVSLGQVMETAPHLTVVYIGEQAAADAHWQLPLGSVDEFATFAARLGDPELAAVIKSVVAYNGELVTS